MPGVSEELAEFGLGIYPGALPGAGLMEAAQSRGTRHLGVGPTLPLGGVNQATHHLDVAIARPTIEVDHCVICRHGRYLF